MLMKPASVRIIQIHTNIQIKAHAFIEHRLKKTDVWIVFKYSGYGMRSWVEWVLSWVPCPMQTYTNALACCWGRRLNWQGGLQQLFVICVLITFLVCLCFWHKQCGHTFQMSQVQFWPTKCKTDAPQMVTEPTIIKGSGRGLWKPSSYELIHGERCLFLQLLLQANDISSDDCYPATSEAVWPCCYGVVLPNDEKEQSPVTIKWSVSAVVDLCLQPPRLRFLLGRFVVLHKIHFVMKTWQCVCLVSACSGRSVYTSKIMFTTTIRQTDSHQWTLVRLPCDITICEWKLS